MVDDALRYERQRRLSAIGAAGQQRLGASRVVIVGCGGLGTLVAESLVRAGVGFTRLIDRDFVDRSNLHRQLLFDERDADDGAPKAVAAARRLRAINSSVAVDPQIADFAAPLALELCRDADLLIDATDNFEARYLLNDVACKLGRPWVYGAAVGVEGRAAVFGAGGACLRCVFPDPPASHLAETCETAGVLGPAVHIAASWQAALAIRLLCDGPESVPRRMLTFDAWRTEQRSVSLSDAFDPGCVCCGERNFEFLEGARRRGATVLCGRNAVQLAPLTEAPVDLSAAAARFGADALLAQNAYLVRARWGAVEITLFADGRAIVSGVDDETAARAAYARYVGA